MADFIPANIIQTPDFGGLAKQYIDRQRQEEANKNAFLDQFEQTQGLYLDGDRPAVQSAWNDVQKAIDIVAENDSPETRRALKQSYAKYSQVAGTAQVLADQHRTQVASYKSDPSKFAMSGTDFFQWDKDFRTKTRSFDDMVSALDNPNVLPSAGSYALLNPYDQAKTLMADSANVAATFYDKSGNLDEAGLRDRISDLATRRIMASPEAVERAIIWGATTKNNPQSGFLGDGDGKINSLEELEMIKNLPEEERQKYFEAYVNALVDDYISLTPGRAAADKSGKKPLAVSSVSIQAAGGQNVDFITLPGSLETSYNIENEDGTKSSVTGNIVQIGAAPNGELFVTVEREVSTGEIDAEGNTVTRMETEYRPATQMEVDKIMSKYGNTYDFSPLTSKGEAAPAQTAPAEEQPAATSEAPAEAPADKPKDSLGLGLFDTPAANEEAPAETPAETPAAEPTQPVVAVDPAIEEKADATMERIKGGISAKQLEEDKPYMLKEAAQLQKDIAATKQKIKDAEANGQDVTELNKALEDQKRVLKKVNELNRKISERRERRAFEESLPTLGEDQPAKEEAKKEAKESTTGEEYIVIDGNVYYKKDYDAVAGKKTGRGNYPDTFEEYADAYGVAIMNTKEEPVGTELDEVTITAERLEPPTQKEDNTVQVAGVSPAVKKADKEEFTPLNSDTYYNNLLVAEGGISTDPTDSAASRPGNQDAPKTIVKGKERLQHTNKGVTYEVFKNWAEGKGIKKEDYHNRFLNLSDDETKEIADSYTISIGADNFKSTALRAIFTQNAWGTGKVWAADFKSGRSPEYRAVLDWLQENTGMEFQSTGKMSAEEAKAIEEFYNKDPKGFIETYTDKKIQHYKTLDTYKQHGAGWVKRAKELRDELIAEL